MEQGHEIGGRVLLKLILYFLQHGLIPHRRLGVPKLEHAGCGLLFLHGCSDSECLGLDGDVGTMLQKSLTSSRKDFWVSKR